MREEVLKILLSITRQEAVAEGITDDEYDTELTKMAEGMTEKGVNEVSAGEKNLDKEFEEGSESHGNQSGANYSQKRNAARKDKKKQRQNKKKGKQR